MIYDDAICGNPVFDEALLEPDPHDQSQRYRGRILIIDDDRDQVQALSTALSRLGFQILLAHDIRAGLEQVHTGDPHLVILDIRLPDGNGLDLCRDLSDDPRTCRTPVIILSGMEKPDIVRRARAAGCHYFLRKPYDPNALLLLVEDALADPD